MEPLLDKTKDKKGTPGTSLNNESRNSDESGWTNAEENHNFPSRIDTVSTILIYLFQK
jgi:hypothetical protein